MTRLLSASLWLLVVAACGLGMGGCDSDKQCRGSVHALPDTKSFALSERERVCAAGSSPRLDFAHGLVICECPVARVDGGAR